jgi:hypothetical protein
MNLARSEMISLRDSGEVATLRPAKLPGIFSLYGRASIFGYIPEETTSNLQHSATRPPLINIHCIFCSIFGAPNDVLVVSRTGSGRAGCRGL